MLVFDPRDYGANPDDNIDDTSAIQAALDAARDAGGGHVYLAAGTYIISSDERASKGGIRIHSNTELSGDGIGETILKVSDSQDSKISGVIRTPVNEVTENVIIRDLTIDGNRENVTAEIDGIQTGVLPGKSESDNNILIERVEIHDVSRIAFNPHEQTTNLTIRDSIAHHNSWDGFIADFTSNAVYENNIAHSNDRHGFNVVTHSHDTVLRDNVSYNNGEQGIVVQKGSGSQSIDGWEDMLNFNILLENNEVYGNGKNGILLKQTTNSQVIGNNVYDNGADAIQLEGANNIIIDGNILRSENYAVYMKPYSGSLGGPGDTHHNWVLNNDIISGDLAFKESGDTTQSNVYANNGVAVDAAKVGESSLVLEDSSAYTYTKLSISADYPDHYQESDVADDDDADNEQPQEPTQPEPDPVVEEKPVVEEEVVVEADPVVEAPVVEAPVEEAPDPVLDTEIIESLFIRGDSSDETINGDAKADVLKGRGGDDTIFGHDGDDYIEGNGGNDVIYGGLGKDKLKGSAGVDTFAYNSLEEGGDTIVDFRFAETIDISSITSKFLGFSRDLAFDAGFIKVVQNGNDAEIHLDVDGRAGDADSVHFLTLSGVKDGYNLNLDHFKTADKGVEQEEIDANLSLVSLVLSGTSGHDVLVGGHVADILKGRGGDDILIGHGGGDDLWGNSGNDILYGGNGADFMKGGDGSDMFIVNANQTGVDIIRDFRVHEGEVLEITDVLSFDPVSDSIEDFLMLTEVGKDTVVSVDADGAANGENFVEVVTLTGITGLGEVGDLYEEGTITLTATASV